MWLLNLTKIHNCVTFVNVTRAWGLTPFSCSTQLGMKFIMLMNVKMPTTTVGILTFISMINTTSESLKARKVFTIHQLSFYKQLKFHAHLSWAWKSINLKARRTKYVLLCNGSIGHQQPTFKWLSVRMSTYEPLNFSVKANCCTLTCNLTEMKTSGVFPLQI